MCITCRCKTGKRITRVRNVYGFPRVPSFFITWAWFHNARIVSWPRVDGTKLYGRARARVVTAYIIGATASPFVTARSSFTRCNKKKREVEKFLGIRECISELFLPRKKFLFFVKRARRNDNTHDGFRAKIQRNVCEG